MSAAIAAICLVATLASASRLDAASPMTAQIDTHRHPGAASLLLRLRGGVREVENVDDWETVLSESADRLLVVDFTAVWCGPCQRIAPAYAALADEFGDTAVFVKVDVDRLGELAAELGVTSMPTFLFFRSGEMIDSMRGADEAGLRALVAEHATAAAAA